MILNKCLICVNINYILYELRMRSNMFEKFSSKVSEIYQFNVDELISGFDEKTQNSVKKLIKKHKISFSALNPNYDASARALGFFLCDIYRKAVEDWKSSPTVDFFMMAEKKSCLILKKNNMQNCLKNSEDCINMMPA